MGGTRGMSSGARLSRLNDSSTSEILPLDIEQFDPDRPAPPFAAGNPCTRPSSASKTSPLFAGNCHADRPRAVQGRSEVDPPATTRPPACEESFGARSAGGSWSPMSCAGAGSSTHICVAGAVGWLQARWLRITTRTISRLLRLRFRGPFMNGWPDTSTRTGSR
jgi:hypothetical protein